MATWYYAKDRQKLGPVSEELVLSLVRDGTLVGTDLVWAEGWPEWKQVAAVPQLAAVLPVGAPPAPPPPSAFAAPTGTAAAGVAPQRPKSPLVWAILATVLCCLPFGIPAIIFASQVDSKWNAGDHAGAVLAAERARMWCWISFGIGFAGGLLYLLVMIAGVAAGNY